MLILHGGIYPLQSQHSFFAKICKKDQATPEVKPTAPEVISKAEDVVCLRDTETEHRQNRELRK